MKLVLSVTKKLFAYLQNESSLTTHLYNAKQIELAVICRYRITVYMNMMTQSGKINNGKFIQNYHVCRKRNDQIQ